MAVELEDNLSKKCLTSFLTQKACSANAIPTLGEREHVLHLLSSHCREDMTQLKVPLMEEEQTIHSLPGCRSSWTRPLAGQSLPR